MTICAFPAPTAPKQGSGSATNLLHLRLGLLQPPVAAQVRGRPGRPPSRGDPLGGRLLSWVGPWGRKAETKCAQSPAVRRADPPPQPPRCPRLLQCATRPARVAATGPVLGSSLPPQHPEAAPSRPRSGALTWAAQSVVGPPGRALTRSSAPQGARRHTEGVTAARPFYSCAGLRRSQSAPAAAARPRESERAGV